MKISAIYIEEHEYMFDKPQTVNFGGKYYYNFKKVENNIYVSRTLNNTFINNFFDLTNLNSRITNINAIVGQNGAGKSTLLDIIRSEFVEHKYAMAYSKSLFLVELEENGHPIILRNDFNKIYLLSNDSKSRAKIELKGNKTNVNIQTIYYSPHYDYKYTSNFNDRDNHDISFDKIVERDLEVLNEKDSNEDGFLYSAAQELLFKNSIRQIEFLTSNLVAKQQIFKDLFHLQEHHDPILHFRGYKESKIIHNTPFGLRKIIETINNKVDTEISNWHKIRKFENDVLLNQIEVNKYILKRNIIKCIISLLYKKMEGKNYFLDEGSFPYSEFEKELNTVNAYDAFIIFVRNSSLITKSEKTIKLFSENIAEDLINKIYTTIDNEIEESSVTVTSLKTSKQDAIDILVLQRKFLNELNRYYYKLYKSIDNEIISDSEKIEEFINYMPFSRRLSSGENALLNLFSRIYNFLNSNLKETKFRKLNQHYILLLDEADLTFHLIWKKRYIKALIKTLPYFFNELENQPSFQIIFTTHDPLTLSDLPNSNVIYIQRNDYNSSANILDYDNPDRPLKTFGANISDLISDSFFIEHSLIGDFAFDKINEAITWLNEENNFEKTDYYEKLIKMIDEPIVQRKLAEMYDNKMQTNFQIEVINEQILKLEALRNKLS